jgi:hypothetical protein
MAWNKQVRAASPALKASMVPSFSKVVRPSFVISFALVFYGHILGCAPMANALGGNRAVKAREATGANPLSSQQALSDGFETVTAQESQCDAAYVGHGFRVSVEGESLCLWSRHFSDTASTVPPMARQAIFEIVTEQGRSPNVVLNSVPGTFVNGCARQFEQVNRWVFERKACVKNTVLGQTSTFLELNELVFTSWDPIVRWTFRPPANAMK